MMLPTSGHSGDELRGVVAVGASAGGVEALTNFASGLPVGSRMSGIICSAGER
jgi:chemotaxis response regulator CheB